MYTKNLLSNKDLPSWGKNHYKQTKKQPSRGILRNSWFEKTRKIPETHTWQNNSFVKLHFLGDI